MSDISPDKNERNPFTRPGFIASAALILVLIAAVIVIAFLPGNDAPGVATPSNSSTPSDPVSTATATEQETRESICGLPSSDETALGAAPETEWELVGTFAAPTSEQHGPGVVSDEVRSCFSHDVTGALYAAVNIAALATAGQEETIYRELSVPSPAREQALEDASSTPPTGGISVQVAGFQIDSYAGDSAVIRLGIRGSNGVILDYPVPLEWHEGDWKLVVPPTGDTGVREIPDLSDFIPWSGA